MCKTSGTLMVSRKQKVSRKSCPSVLIFRQNNREWYLTAQSKETGSLEVDISFRSCYLFSLSVLVISSSRVEGIRGRTP